MTYLILLLLLSSLALVFAVPLDNQFLKEYTSNNSLLTSDIYKELTQNFESNFLVSPFSVQTVLALTHSGAKGPTAEELRAGLRLPSTKEKVENIFENVLPQIKSDQFSLYSANKIYVKENFPISTSFEKTATEVYNADLENINFGKNVEAAEKINKWVEDQTRNKIRELISSEDLNEESRLVLINGLYFQGNWSVPFRAARTVPRKFYKTETEAIDVDMMHSRTFFHYYECSQVDAKFLELPFKGEEASMFIVLPNKKDGIAYLESKVDEVFTPKNFTEELVQVALPKFKIETTIDFKQILKNLGIKKIFSASESDLSGISTSNETLVVDKVLQKTFIDVSEGGVEAAAATLVSVKVAISPALPQPQPEKFFIADHPFIFYIKVRGVVLFGGRVSMPKIQ